MKILSISGGGFQALYNVILLEELEKLTGPVKDSFDLFCGTSAGAIVAAAAATGMPMAELRAGFEERGAEAFRRRSIAGPRDLWRLWGRSRYMAAPLEALVGEIVGEVRFAELEVLLAVTTVRLHDGAAVVFSNQTSPDVKSRDAVMASAAAPTMFPAVAVDGRLHADGAIFANAPDLLAMELALRTEARTDEISMLSLGSMNACPPLGEPRDADMGVLDWLRGNRIFRTMIGAQAEVTGRLMSGLLGERYTRIDADPGFPMRSDVALDKADSKAIEAARVAASLSLPALEAWAQASAVAPLRRAG
jgi:patatin-like phospholipase/acyl hydrolase